MRPSFAAKKLLGNLGVWAVLVSCLSLIVAVRACTESREANRIALLKDQEQILAHVTNYRQGIQLLSTLDEVGESDVFFSEKAVGVEDWKIKEILAREMPITTALLGPTSDFYKDVCLRVPYYFNSELKHKCDLVWEHALQSAQKNSFSQDLLTKLFEKLEQLEDGIRAEMEK